MVNTEANGVIARLDLELGTRAVSCVFMRPSPINWIQAGNGRHFSGMFVSSLSCWSSERAAGLF